MKMADMENGATNFSRSKNNKKEISCHYKTRYHQGLSKLLQGP